MIYYYKYLYNILANYIYIIHRNSDNRYIRETAKNSDDNNNNINNINHNIDNNIDNDINNDTSNAGNNVY